MNLVELVTALGSGLDGERQYHEGIPHELQSPAIDRIRHETDLLGSPPVQQLVGEFFDAWAENLGDSPEHAKEDIVNQFRLLLTFVRAHPERVDRYTGALREHGDVFRTLSPAHAATCLDILGTLEPAERRKLLPSLRQGSCVLCKAHGLAVGNADPNLPGRSFECAFYAGLKEVLASDPRHVCVWADYVCRKLSQPPTQRQEA
jgi:hypothetical protein